MDNENQILEEISRLRKEIFSGKAKNFNFGEHLSKFGGIGFEIKDIQEWERGDPYSSINWPMSLVTYPKLYKLDRIETKETPVAIIADCSPSMFLGFNSSNDKFKLLLHLIGTFSFTASYFHDRVCLALSGIEEEFFVPLKYGHSHVMVAIYRLVECAKDFHKAVSKGKSIKNSGLSLNEAIELMSHRMRRQGTIVIISDFMDAVTGKVPLDMEMVEYLSAKHKQNVVALFVQDDDEFLGSGKGGTVITQDIETGRTHEIKASRLRSLRHDFDLKRQAIRKSLSDIGVESIVISWTDYSSRLSDFMMARR